MPSLVGPQEWPPSIRVASDPALDRFAAEDRLADVAGPAPALVMEKDGASGQGMDVSIWRVARRRPGSSAILPWEGRKICIGSLPMVALE